MTSAFPPHLLEISKPRTPGEALTPNCSLKNPGMLSLGSTLVEEGRLYIVLHTMRLIPATERLMTNSSGALLQKQSLVIISPQSLLLGKLRQAPLDAT